MHMSIDVARQDEFPVALDPAGTDRDTAFFAAGDALDFVAINYDNGVLNHLAVRRINCGTADQGNFLSKRAGRKRRSDEESNNSISIAFERCVIDLSRTEIKFFDDNFG